MESKFATIPDVLENMHHETLRDFLAHKGTNKELSTELPGTRIEASKKQNYTIYCHFFHRSTMFSPCLARLFCQSFC